MTDGKQILSDELMETLEQLASQQQWSAEINRLAKDEISHTSRRGRGEHTDFP